MTVCPFGKRWAQASLYLHYTWLLCYVMNKAEDAMSYIEIPTDTIRGSIEFFCQDLAQNYLSSLIILRI